MKDRAKKKGKVSEGIFKIRIIFVCFLVLLGGSALGRELYLSSSERITNELMDAGIAESAILYAYEDIKSIDIPTDSGNVILCGTVSRTLRIENNEEYEIAISGNCLIEPGSIKTDGRAGMILRGSRIRIDGLSVQATGSSAVVVEGSNVYLSRMEIAGSVNGVLIRPDKRVDNLSLVGNRILNNEKAGVIFYDSKSGVVLKNIYIRMNYIAHNGNHGIRLWFKRGAKSAYAKEILIEGNILRNNGADGIVVIHQGVDDNNKDGAILDLAIRDNTISYGAGGIAVRGAEPKDRTEILVSGNRMSNLSGVTGGVNLFWSKGVIVKNNIIRDLDTPRVDGNGILIDHGNRGVVVKGNIIRRSRGNGIVNSGVGIMVLDNEDIVLEDNVIEDCNVGMYFGGRRSSRKIVARRNLLRDNRTSVYVDPKIDQSELVIIDQ